MSETEPVVGSLTGNQHCEVFSTIWSAIEFRADQGDSGCKRFLDPPKEDWRNPFIIQREDIALLDQRIKKYEVRDFAYIRKGTFGHLLTCAMPKIQGPVALKFCVRFPGPGSKDYDYEFNRATSKKESFLNPVNFTVALRDQNLAEILFSH